MLKPLKNSKFDKKKHLKMPFSEGVSTNETTFQELKSWKKAHCGAVGSTVAKFRQNFTCNKCVYFMIYMLPL